ncbi:hypothetical protein F4604DRAFT_2020783 [Suillus subluteus]|nr:hypothetical protein F4604DRAFT_2020783 [Suillus subluteus]
MDDHAGSMHVPRSATIIQLCGQDRWASVHLDLPSLMLSKQLPAGKNLIELSRTQDEECGREKFSLNPSCSSNTTSSLLSSLPPITKLSNKQHSNSKYVDREIKFVLENLGISLLSLLPGHIYIHNITDIDITAPAGSQSTTTAIGTLTHIQMQAVQLTLKEVSFFYRDKVATIRPKDFTGLMECGLLQKGIDIDLEFCLIPNTPQGLMEHKSLRQFFKIEHVEVNVAEDIDMQVK